MSYTDVCGVKIIYQDITYTTEGFSESPWFITEDITVQDHIIGSIKVHYSEERTWQDESPFLKEEKRALASIAMRVGHYILYQNLRPVFDDKAMTREVIDQKQSGDWRGLIELLKRTDPDVLTRISRKMLNYLIWRGVEAAESLLQEFMPFLRYGQQDIIAETNIPLQKKAFDNSYLLIQKVFGIASDNLSEDEIISHIQDWVKQDKTSFLVRAVSSINSSLTEIANAIRRYFSIAPDGLELAPSARIGVRAALIRRFFSDQLEFVVVAKNFVRISDFHELINHMVCPSGSHGKLGGKSAGLFLANRILKENEEQQPILKDIKVPKTWYVTSDAMLQFMHYNNLEELLEQKYKPIDEIRREYPHLVMMFKNSHFPPELVQGLSMALDNFHDKPLIVRSSSLLEDRLGSAFSGKYKSLFLVNQGTKNERLDALLDAIAEVYASTLGPDPMQYRSERGLTDFHEEMGIMIQEVVGQKIGKFFLPAYAGVAFSNNEFRWSPRIKREDGLIRLVPGLGTRAVDRLSDDYPVLIAPGQPGLRANVGIEERVRYSPQKADLLNIEENRFETVNLTDIFKELGDSYPALQNVISVYSENHLREPIGFNLDFNPRDAIVTFEGLIRNTKFVKQVHAILRTLQNALATPVDIEFASDGQDFYLLQCRPQSYAKYDAPSPIPKELPPDRTIFTANRYVSNGTVPDITHVVYVDADHYNQLDSVSEMMAVGRAIGKLNQVLPRRQFILMGPGRWGSRGDIKLGVNVTYSDINNCSMLIEIARQKGNYVPDLSFGTHFFQDLVEAQIRYLPLYPDEKGIIFNTEFLSKSPNALYEMLPSFAHLSDTVRVIEVPANTNGMVLRVLMNADLDKAVGILTPRGVSDDTRPELESYPGLVREAHWRWRRNMAEKIAAQIDPKKFGIKAVYVIGSTGTATAQAGSDIDLLINFTGTATQKKELINWLNGWSLCLDEINFMRTGYKAGGLLDIHYVTDAELKDKKSIEKRLNINVNRMYQLALSGQKIGPDKKSKNEEAQG
jgi:hypothetical protein